MRTSLIIAASRPLIGIDTCKGSEEESDLHPNCAYVNLNYPAAVERAGGIPVLLPLSHDSCVLEASLELISGLIITGGDDIHPGYYGYELSAETKLEDNDRVDWDLFLLRQAFERDLPVLCICYGMQLMNVAFGGTLYQDLQTQRPGIVDHGRWRDPQVHGVNIANGSMLRRAHNADRIMVASSHHQGVLEVGTGLEVTARADDDLVEAVEVPGRRFTVGVQWHPERSLEGTRGIEIFHAFVSACKEYGSQGKPNMIRR